MRARLPASNTANSTYIIRFEAFMCQDSYLAELRVDLVALESGDALVALIIHRYHDVAISQEGQLHGFFQQTALPFVEADL